MSEESKFAEERRQIFKEAVKKLMNKIELICDDYELSLVRLFNGPMGIDMSRTEIHSRFTNNLIRSLEDAISDMFQMTAKNVEKLIEEESYLLKKNRDTASSDAIEESKHGTIRRIEHSILNSDTILLNQSKNMHMRNVGNVLDDLSRVNPNVRRYEVRIEDFVAETFGMIQKACERTLEDINYAITKGSEKLFTEIAKGKKEEKDNKTSVFPQELLINLRRILALSGYNLIIDGDTFFAVTEDNRELHIINFDETYHMFSFADDPSKGKFCIGVSKNGQNPSDIYVAPNKAISFNIQNGSLIVRDDKTGIRYGINATGEEAVAMIMGPEGKQISSPDEVMNSIEALFPGISDAYYKVINKKKDDLNKDNQEENSHSYPGYL